MGRRWIDWNDFVKVQRRLQRASFRLEMANLERTWPLATVAAIWGQVRAKGLVRGLAANIASMAIPCFQPFSRKAFGLVTAQEVG